MKIRIHKVFIALITFILSSCAGWERSCATGCAENLGSDWVVVQIDYSGKPFRCWSLQRVSIANESTSDGIYWMDSATKNLVHISGNYNRVQVSNGNWKEAYAEVGLTQESCIAIHNKRF